MFPYIFIFAAKIYTIFMNSVGNYLKQQRLLKKMSLKEAASSTGLTDTKIQRIESDNVLEASPKAIKALCDLYRIPLLPIYIQLGWLSADDLDIKTHLFKDAYQLTEAEKAFIQSQIDFLLKHRSDSK